MVMFAWTIIHKLSKNTQNPTMQEKHAHHLQITSQLMSFSFSFDIKTSTDMHTRHADTGKDVRLSDLWAIAKNL